MNLPIRAMKRIASLVVCLIMVVSIIEVMPVDTQAATMKLSNTSITLYKGKTKTLSIKNKGNAKVTWSTNNKYAVKVSGGTVKALKQGAATVYARCKGKTYSCRVKIPDNARKITLSTYKMKLAEGRRVKLTSKSTAKVTYISMNDEVASVTTNGLVTAKNPGKVKIIAKNKRGAKTCTVNVFEKGGLAVSSWLKNKKMKTIRRVTAKGKVKYGAITWGKNKAIALTIDNVKESKVKKVTWKVDNSEIVSKPKHNGGKLKAVAETLKSGHATVTAKVTYKTGSTKTYTNNIYVTKPKANKDKVVCLTGKIGSYRHQYIAIEGLSSYSKVDWSNSNTKAVKATGYRNKIKLYGKKKGKGVITAKVDGKTLKIPYSVKKPTIKKVSGIIAQGKSKKIVVSGVAGAKVSFSSRDTAVAVVNAAGKVTAKSGGVTYIDVKVGNMNFTNRVECASKGMKTIINRAQWICNNWTYSQGARMSNGYYDCSSLVWKGYKAYKNYNLKLGGMKNAALCAADLYTWLSARGKIVYTGFTCLDDLQPGDLFFYGDYNNACKYSTPGRTLNIYHVAMYRGAGRVVEKGGKNGRKYNYNGTKYIVGVGRVVK